MRQLFPDAPVLNTNRAEISFQLPHDGTALFPDLLRRLERDELGIRSVGLSMTSLEEVFLKINNERHEEE